MGILDLVEEAAGAFAAVKGVEKLDPDAGLLEKGMAAYAGFKGVELIKEKLAEHEAQTEVAEQQGDGNVETA
jgi:hypothetical protein